ncbi:hypothetical protein F443_08711 [Phytophthora nicotianae P1569]|uniref:HAT C-terminal dimerisation domain-containing protein n=1 Tax=Phytophthora nicotianae P1569 TaxID=1317065 RepID=V9F7C8_PHYNI|nr:hypothetical protein F443_08711 [Phytophthora nicotianae P1569]
MQACFASLLRVRSALGDLVHAYRNDPEFPKASFRLQKDDNTMTDVVCCYGKIHAAFVASPYASHLVPVVEKRWANCDQPLMLLAFALHPLYVTHTRRLIEAHNNTVFLMSVDGISAAADYYYRRYVDANNNGLTGDVDKWLWGKCTPKMYTDFTDPNGILQSSGVIAFWVHVGASKCGKESKLPHIAKVILSVSMNTATCERYFSELGLIHTPRRNKLRFDKTRLISIIRNEVRERNRREGDTDETCKPKKPIDPTERPKKQTNGVSDSATSLPSLAENTDVDYMETVGAVDFWLEAIAGLEEDVPPNFSSVENEEEEWYVYDADMEPIPVADRSQKLPGINVSSFPQETCLSGIRAQKSTLGALFSCHMELFPAAASQ